MDRLKGFESYEGLNRALVLLYSSPAEVYEFGDLCCLGVSEFLSLRVVMRKFS